MPRPSSKESILDAAAAIVAESGASRMTLDAVASRAGISKGGLIYNFPTKEALLEAMITRMATRFEGLREQARKQLSSKPFNELMVEIQLFRGKSGIDKRLSAALLAVVANQPRLTQTLGQRARDRLIREIAPEGDFERSAILYFAALGLHFHDLLNLPMLDVDQRSAIFDELMRLASRDKDMQTGTGC